MNTLPSRFWAKVEKTETCWLWTGRLNKKGYACFGPKLAHRVSYEALVGPIAAGLQLDHVRSRGCLNRHCVNPEHLEPVTNAENCRRAEPATKSHCKNGHPFDEKNTYFWPSDPYRQRRCRACHLARYHAKKLRTP